MKNTGVVSAFRVSVWWKRQTVHPEMIMSVLSAMMGSAGAVHSHLRSTYPCLREESEKAYI